MKQTCKPIRRIWLNAGDIVMMQTVKILLVVTSTSGFKEHGPWSKCRDWFKDRQEAFLSLPHTPIQQSSHPGVEYKHASKNRHYNQEDSKITE
jgi:hypothetical protein